MIKSIAAPGIGSSDTLTVEFTDDCVSWFIVRGWKGKL